MAATGQLANKLSIWYTLTNTYRIRQRRLPCALLSHFKNRHRFDIAEVGEKTRVEGGVDHRFGLGSHQIIATADSLDCGWSGSCDPLGGISEVLVGRLLSETRSADCESESFNVHIRSHLIEWITCSEADIKFAHRPYCFRIDLFFHSMALSAQNSTLRAADRILHIFNERSELDKPSLRRKGLDKYWAFHVHSPVPGNYFRFESFIQARDRSMLVSAKEDAHTSSLNCKSECEPSPHIRIRDDARA